MTDRELMQMALDAMRAVSVDEHLCNAAHHVKKDRHGIDEPCPIAKRFNDIAEALRARLEQPEQDDGYCQVCDGNHCTAKNGCIALDNPIAQPEHGDGYRWREGDVPPSMTYTAPPQREWQGLTDEEIENFVQAVWPKEAVPADYIRAVEAKLKEKNT